MVDREEARRLAEYEIQHGRLRPRARSVHSAEELKGWQPILYQFPEPDLTRCWIAFVEQLDVSRLGSSTIILIDRETGAAAYTGSAHDEG
jgi:hypothetical protein